MTSEPLQPRAGALAREARRVLTKEIMPAGAFVSLPVPVVREGVLAASFFGAITVAREDGTNEDMYAPAVEVTLDWATGRQLELRVLRAAAPAAGEVTVAEIRPVNFQLRMPPGMEANLEAQIERLHGLLDAAARRYGASPQRPPMDDGTRYLEQWEDLVPRTARAYYTALNPDFFAWVARGR